MAAPTFLGLPQELRDEIYRHLHGKHIQIRPAEQGDTLLPTAILQVSKQVSFEAQEIMLKEHTFSVSDCQVLEPQWTTILKALNLRIRIIVFIHEPWRCTFEHV